MKYFLFLVGIPLQLLGLTGLVENIVIWHGFIAEIVSVYTESKAILFGWLPFTIPSWAEDYLIVGLGLATSHIRASFIGTIDAVKVHEEYGQENITIWEFMSFFLISRITFAFILLVILWPLTIFTNTLLLVWHPKEYEGVTIAPHFWSGVAIVVVVFVGCLFLFSDVLQRL